MSPVTEPYLATDAALGYTTLDPVKARAAALHAAEHNPDPDTLRHTLRVLLGPHWQRLAQGPNS